MLKKVSGQLRIIINYTRRNDQRSAKMIFLYADTFLLPTSSASSLTLSLGLSIPSPTFTMHLSVCHTWSMGRVCKSFWPCLDIWGAFRSFARRVGALGSNRFIAWLSDWLNYENENLYDDTTRTVVVWFGRSLGACGEIFLWGFADGLANIFQILVKVQCLAYVCLETLHFYKNFFLFISTTYLTFSFNYSIVILIGFYNWKWNFPLSQSVRWLV